MNEQFSRTELILGEKAMQKLSRSRVAVFGLGGVGGQAAEALCRGGIGALDLVDYDTVSLSNLNRQIFADHDTVGMYKTDAAKLRLMKINPELKLTPHRVFFLPDTEFSLNGYDYIVDAVDNVTAKLELVQRARSSGVPIISSMGTGNKLDPTKLCVANIYETSVCPLARIMRRELKKRGIERLKVVYSSEEPIIPASGGENTRKPTPGSVSFVPPAAGLIIAGEVIKDLIRSEK